jgi:hypothetical protein
VAATVLEEMVRKLAQYQDKESRESVAKNHYRLGRIVTSRSGPHGVTEVWEEGQAMKVSQTHTLSLPLDNSSVLWPHLVRGRA